MVQEVLDDVVPFILLAGLQVSVGLEDLVAGIIVFRVHDDLKLVGAETVLGFILLSW